MNDWQTIFDCYIQGSDDLLDRQRIPRSTLYARVICVNYHLASRYNADTDDLRCAWHIPL